MNDANRCDNCGELLVVKPNPSGTVGWVHTCKPTTPRVANSLSDLAVGMVVAWKWRGGAGDGDLGWRLDEGLVWFSRDDAEEGEMEEWWKSKEVIVILADPPAPPARDWLVPADTMEALREAILGWNGSRNIESKESCTLHARARAVLDAATEVERDG